VGDKVSDRVGEERGMGDWEHVASVRDHLERRLGRARVDLLSDGARDEAILVALNHEHRDFNRVRVKIGLAAQITTLRAERVQRVRAREVGLELGQVPVGNRVWRERHPARRRVKAAPKGRNARDPRQAGARQELDQRLGQRGPLFDAGPDTPDKHQASDAGGVPLRSDDGDRPP